MNPTVYIDQNILSYLVDDILTIPHNDFQIIFSKVHLKEFPKENPVPFIKLLDDYGARMIEIKLDENFQMKDDATILYYYPVSELYKTYILKNKSEKIENIFDPFLARLAGADNYDSAINLPDDLITLISIQMNDSKLNPQIMNLLSPLITHFKNMLKPILQNTEDIESFRFKLGTEKGRLSTFKGPNIIQDINELIFSKTGHNILLSLEQILHNKTLFQKVIVLNWFLNMVGFHPDKKLKSVTKMPNSRNDGEHIAYALYCDYFLTEDKRLFFKFDAIIKYLKLNTQVFLLIDK